MLLSLKTWTEPNLKIIQGIRFHGLSIPEAQKVLPTAKDGNEIIAEGMLWLLLTGQGEFHLSNHRFRCPSYSPTTCSHPIA